LGANATVTAGSSLSSIWSSGWDTSSLYETEESSSSSGGDLAQGTGSDSFVELSGFFGAAVGTLTTATSAFLATDSATAPLGSDATTTGGSSTHTLYETGSDSTTDTAAGGNTYNFDDGGPASDSSTYDTGDSSNDRDTDTFTQSDSDVTLLTGGGVIA